VLEKAVIDNRKATINAKISAQIIEFYKLALANCDKNDFVSVVGNKKTKEFKQYCNFKITYYQSMVHYYSAINSYEQKKIGESVGYIQVAEEKINECIKMKYLKEFNDCLKFTADVIETK
jgi:tyrosine-protein phosphatase non-receptor type 23